MSSVPRALIVFTEKNRWGRWKENRKIFKGLLVKKKSKTEFIYRISIIIEMQFENKRRH